jgi:hypothetical protein
MITRNRRNKKISLKATIYTEKPADRNMAQT